MNAKTTLLIGGFVVVVVAAVLAPAAHDDRTLPAEVEVDVENYEQTEAGVVEIAVTVTNHDDDPLNPAWSTWDQFRKTKHGWDTVEGPDTVPPGESAAYIIRAPGPEAAINTGTRARVIVHDVGESESAGVTIDIDEVLPI